MRAGNRSACSLKKSTSKYYEQRIIDMDMCRGVFANVVDGVSNNIIILKSKQKISYAKKAHTLTRTFTVDLTFEHISCF